MSYNPMGADTKGAGRGVMGCGWTLRAERLARLVRVEQAGQPVRAYLGGLMVCGLRWVCPCCTAALSEESRANLNAALHAGRARGLRPVMLTLTARHDRRTPLVEFWARLSAAEQDLKRTRAWKALNADHLGGGFAKATELTHGANGWHPHFHLVLMVSAATEAEAIDQVETLRAEWLARLEREGLDGKTKAARARAFDVRGAAAAGEYITKWGAAEEMTLGAAKVGGAEGRTPWQLLRDARTHESEAERRRAAALWYEFVQVFRGVHQLRQSPKFRALVAAGVAALEAKAEGEDKPAPVESVLAVYVESLWSRARFRRLRLVEAGEGEDAEASKAAAARVLWDARTDKDDLADDDPGPLVEGG